MNLLSAKTLPVKTPKAAAAAPKKDPKKAPKKDPKVAKVVATKDPKAPKKTKNAKKAVKPVRPAVLRGLAANWMLSSVPPSVVFPPRQIMRDFSSVPKEIPFLSYKPKPIESHKALFQKECKKMWDEIKESCRRPVFNHSHSFFRQSHSSHSRHSHSHSHSFRHHSYHRSNM